MKDPETKRLHRVDSNALPSVKKAMVELQDNLGDIGYWIGDQQRDERTLLSEWEGQHYSGRKWDSEYGGKNKVSPWDGSADTIIREADAASDELVMIMVMAFITANPSAIQQNAYDASAAGKVQTLLKYEMRQRMLAELWEEMNFFANWGVHYGHAIARVCWKREYVTGKGSISVEELAAWAAQVQVQKSGVDPQQAEAQMPMIVEGMTHEIEALMDDPARMAQLVQLMQGKYPLLSPKRAAKVARQLAKERDTVEFRLPIEQPGKPFVRAYCPGTDFFRPWKTGKVNDSPWKATVERWSEPEVWAKINTDGWEEDFCEALIKQGPQRAISQGSMDPTGAPYTVGRQTFDNLNTDSANRRNQEMHGYYEVVHMWVTAVDEDHFPATFEIIFHPAIGDKDSEPMFAINRMVDDYVGEFVEWRREYKSRSAYESRGVPRLVRLPQMERKWMRDGRLNRNEMATNPPIRTTRKNAYGKPERLGLAPGRVMMEERGQESGFVEPPRFDEGSVEEEQMISRDVANLLGLFNEGVLPAKTSLHQQFIVNNFLTACREIAIKIIQNDQRYMDPLNVSQVIGNGPLPFSVDRDQIAGQFDIQFEFDVRMNDADYVKETWEVMIQAMNADSQGTIDRSKLIRWLIQSKSPTLADMVCGDPQAVAQDEADDERKCLAAAMLGVATMPKPGGNPQARLDAINQEYQTNAMFKNAYDTNPDVQKIVQSRSNTFQFQIDQQKNAGIGNTGYVPPKLGDQPPAP